MVKKSISSTEVINTLAIRLATHLENDEPSPLIQADIKAKLGDNFGYFKPKLESLTSEVRMAGTKGLLEICRGFLDEQESKMRDGLKEIMDEAANGETCKTIKDTVLKLTEQEKRKLQSYKAKVAKQLSEKETSKTTEWKPKQFHPKGKGRGRNYNR